MNTDQFVEIIRKVVVEPSVRAVESNLLKPPGRNPSKHLIEFAEWFNHLGKYDKDVVRDIVREAIETSVFSFLCVLDGVTTIEEGVSVGQLKLFYKNGEDNVFLNDPEGEYMHDIFNAHH